MAIKRKFSTFNLSFLDIMSCGFGAVILIFLIIKHDADDRVEAVNKDLLAEVNLLQEEVSEGTKSLVKIKNTISALDQTLVSAEGRARQIRTDIDFTQGKIKDLDQSSAADKLNELKQEVKQLEQEKSRLEEENDQLGDDILRTIGQGDRQYLTGLKLGGSRILILVDSSASMLGDKIVNIIRKRNMSDGAKNASRKWQRALATTEWLSAQLPDNALYQIYTFNTDVTAAIAGSEDRWLELSDGAELEQALLNLRATIPSGGTSLINTFNSINNFTDLPDNIFLITDGLPTQGESRPKKSTINSSERVKLFNKARKVLPANIPLNIVLFPMEGDPMAASAYWKLAQASNGSFLSPSEDWP